MTEYRRVLKCSNNVRLRKKIEDKIELVQDQRLGPIILIPGTLYYLVKATINPSSYDENVGAKV